MDQILEKLVLANKRKKIFFDLAQKKLFIPRSLKTTRKNRTSSIAGPIKKVFLQNLNILT
jgi:hypothetical protein